MAFDLPAQLKAHVEWAEGRRPFLYEDSVGKLTIGVGRNLDDRGLSDDEIDYLLRNDLNIAMSDAHRFDFFSDLSDVRKLVVVDMVFNMGFKRFSGFVKTIAAIEARDYQAAAVEMRDSKWYRQTGRRAKRLVYAMATGVWK